MYSRRSAILGGLALVSGCQSLASPDDGDEPCQYAAVAEPFDPVADLPPEYGRFQRALAERAIERGRARAVFGPRPLLDTSFVESDGSFYRIDLAARPTIDLPALVLSVAWEPEQTPDDDRPVLDFEDLPGVDRRAVRAAVYGGLYRERVHPDSVLDVSSSPFPYPDGIDASALAEREALWVRWDGRVYEVIVHRRTTAPRRVSEYTAERVAGDADAFRSLIAERYVVGLGDVTPEEREILAAAVRDGYERETESPDPAWERLVSRLPERALPAAHYEWYVSFDGESYHLRLASNEQCRR